jgi:hypothetical protein
VPATGLVVPPPAGGCGAVVGDWVEPGAAVVGGVAAVTENSCGV